ncbi:unnamed protein product [Ectocarpus sp. 12 AP-2014]
MLKSNLRLPLSARLAPSTLGDQNNNAGFMATVFGESGPTNVEVLNHPTRRKSKGAAGPPGPSRRMSADSEAAAAEAGDHFEMLPPSGAQAPRLPQRPTMVQAPLSSGSDRVRQRETEKDRERQRQRETEHGVLPSFPCNHGSSTIETEGATEEIQVV